MIEAALVTLLEAAAPLQALVGARIYNTQAPDDEAQPHLVFAAVSGQHINGINANTGWRRGRYQLTAWASSPTAARAIRAAAQAALDRYKGTVAGTVIDDITFADGPSGYDGLLDRYYRITDALIDYQET